MPARDATSPSAQDIADTALLVAHVRSAGEIARSFFGGTYRSWSKSEGSPVTDADLAVDDFLKDHLLRARPDYGWLSEETEDDASRLARSRIFVVDPIDGTRAFVKGLPEFTVVGTVVAEGRPVAAAIYNPATDDMFEATAKGGARRNGQPMQVSAKTDFEHARILGGERFFRRAEWNPPWPNSMSVDQLGSIAYRMSLVAAGAYDAMVSATPKYDWDVAAGDLIVTEAGGAATAHDGTALLYNREPALQKSLICGGPAIHAALLARLREVNLPFR